MDYSYLIKSVGWGEEYNFHYNQKEYWISSNENGFYLTEVDGEYQSFKTSNDFFEGAKIEGKSILDIWDDIKKYF